MATATFTPTSALPASDQKRFNQIVQCYEKKAYKKGVKWADQLLKKYPNHAESISMKGIIFTCIGKKEEGLQLAKNGLRIGLASHVCWHVLGLIHRMDKNYQEAMKCYKNALRIQPDNQQILKDLCLLQVQIRDYEGLKTTRHQLLDLKPNLKVSWIGLAISYHLLGHHDLAASILQTYDSNEKNPTVDPNTLKDKNGWPKPLDFDRSEILLYRCTILEESGKYAEALQALEQSKLYIADVRSWKELKGQILIKLGNVTEAETIYRGLVQENPNNKAYLEGLERCINPAYLELPLSEELEQKRLAFYKELNSKYPSSHLIQRLPLSFATGERFRALADAYLQRRLRKGIPSLFNDVRSLYKDPVKVTVFEELITGYITNLTTHKSFTAPATATAPTTATATGTTDGAAAPNKESSDALLWTKLFAALHNDACGKTEKALQLIDEAIEHTPTLIELYTSKAKILKHAGDISQAADLAVIAKDLDTADKFLNSFCAKYQMKDCRNEAASETLRFFNKDAADHIEHLSDMQCMWFELERANSFAAQQNYGKALRYYHLVEKQFQDIYDDQFDFHTYCIRKMTLRDYVKLLRLEDNIRGHKFYFKAATSAVQTYLQLFDKATEAAAAPVVDDGIDEKERKKALSKQRRAQAKAQADVKKDTGKDGSSSSSSSSSKDEKKDDSGDSYIQNIQPLDEALKFLNSLKAHSSNKIDTHLLAFEVYFRRNKPILMLQALNKSIKLDANNAYLHKQIVSFALKYADTSSLNPVVANIVKEGIASLLKGLTVGAFNSKFLSDNAKSFLHVVKGAESLALLAPESTNEAIRLISDALKNSSIENRNLKNATVAYNVMKTLSKDNQVTAQFVSEAAKVFPYATIFKTKA